MNTALFEVTLTVEEVNKFKLTGNLPENRVKIEMPAANCVVVRIRFSGFKQQSGEYELHRCVDWSL
jgi:hypothetical protein